MQKPLTRHQALGHFLGFDPALAIDVCVPGRAPWHVPPTEYPPQVDLEGWDLDDLVPAELQGIIQLRGGRRAAGRLSDFEVTRPRAVVPDGFAIRHGALGWRALRDLRQFLRETFPIDAVIADTSDRAVELLEMRDELARAIAAYFSERPHPLRAALGAARAWRAGATEESALLWATARAVREQWRAEDREQRREMLAEEDDDARAVELPAALNGLAALARRDGRAGRPPTTALVVAAVHGYGLKPRDAAMLVGLERGNTGRFPVPYDGYFAGKSREAVTAWRRIFYRGSQAPRNVDGDPEKS